MTKWYAKKTCDSKGVCLYETVKVAVPVRVMGFITIKKLSTVLCEFGQDLKNAWFDRDVQINFSNNPSLCHLFSWSR